MAPPSQELEPPTNPGRFRSRLVRTLPSLDHAPETSGQILDAVRFQVVCLSIERQTIIGHVNQVGEQHGRETAALPAQSG
jgi:hypothetical protein